MVMKAEQDTVYDAVERDPRGGVYWIEGDDVQVADVARSEEAAGPEEVPSDDAPHSVHELTALARREVERVEREYDMPFAAEDVTIVVADKLGMANGAASPIDCGTYTADSGEWRVEETPSSYVIFLCLDAFSFRGDDATRTTVRHEIAHLTNWHEHRRTVEGEGIHDAALERFDAKR